MATFANNLKFKNLERMKKEIEAQGVDLKELENRGELDEATIVWLYNIHCMPSKSENSMAAKSFRTKRK